MSVLPTTGRFSGSHLTSGLLPIRCQFFLANGQWNNSPLGTPYGAKRFYYVLEFVKRPSDFRFDNRSRYLQRRDRRGF